MPAGICQGQQCRAVLKDRLSTMYGLCATCRDGMTKAQLAYAMLANQNSDNPALRRATDLARAAAEPPQQCECGCGALASRCPDRSLRETNPMAYLEKRVAAFIEHVRAERRRNRDAYPLTPIRNGATP